MFWVIHTKKGVILYVYIFFKIIWKKGGLCWVLQKKVVLVIHEKDVLCHTDKKRWIVLGNTEKGESCTAAYRNGWFALGHT